MSTSVLPVLGSSVCEICALLVFYAEQIGSYLPTFRDNVPDPYYLTLVDGQIIRPEISVQYFQVLCLFSWRYNALWLYFHSPVAGFSLLVFEVS